MDIFTQQKKVYIIKYEWRNGYVHTENKANKKSYNRIENNAKEMGKSQTEERQISRVQD